MSHFAAGIVKANHQIPTKKRTSLSASVEETFILDMRKRIKLLKIWTETAAM